MSDKQQPVSAGMATGVERAERDSTLVIVPPADIFEDAEGITLQLDMPGVTRERLDLQANKNTLLIEGEAQIEMAPGMTALYADVRSTRYRRSFVLSDELDTEKTEAGIRDGVLTVRIPKRIEVRPRRIEVQAG
jgi:HSP20 family molecular chaperone IbpA